MSAPDPNFQGQRSPVEGLDAAAEAFFKQEQERGGAEAPVEPPAGGPPSTPPVESPADTPSPEPAAPEAPSPESTPDEAPASEVEPGSAAGDETSEAVEPDPTYEIDPAASFDLDGESVTGEELRSGYMRQSDYTRKTQDVAQARQALDNERTAGLQHVGNLVNNLEQAVRALSPDPREMDHLRKTDPAEFSARVLEMQRRDNMLGQARHEHARLEEQARQDRIPREIEALQQISPVFKKNFDAEYGRLGHWITHPEGGGLPSDVWARVTDHRVIKLAHDAMLYHRATRTSAPKLARKLSRKPRTLRPGTGAEPARPGEAQEREQAAAMDHLKQNPDSLDASAAAFLAREKMRR